MIIESACHLVKLKLIERKDCTHLREEEFSYLTAATCESILNSLGLPFPYRIVQVEALYPESSERCDFSIDNSSFNLPYAEFNHTTYAECKFFRKNKTGGNQTNLAHSLWKDFRKVIVRGKGFPYSIVLCEKDYKKVLPNAGIHGNVVDKCFNPNSETQFSLWDNQGLSPTNNRPFQLIQNNATDIEIKVSRSFTEPFPLMFKKETKLFRIYIFKLFSKNHCCKAFEF